MVNLENISWHFLDFPRVLIFENHPIFNPKIPLQRVAQFQRNSGSV